MDGRACAGDAGDACNDDDDARLHCDLDAACRSETLYNVQRPRLAPAPSLAAGAFKFDFEEQDLDEAAVRRMVWEEMGHYDGRK